MFTEKHSNVPKFIYGEYLNKKIFASKNFLKKNEKKFKKLLTKTLFVTII